VKTIISLFFVLLLQGCMTWSRQWDLGICREFSTGECSCAVKVPKSSEVVNVGVNILFGTAQHGPVKSLRIQIKNEESRAVQIQGVSPFVILGPGESHELNVTVGQDTYGAYVCAFNTSDGAVRVKFSISGDNLDGTTIKITGLAGHGP
jgi:hypothetical protein